MGGGGGGGRRTGLRKVKAQITIVRGSPNHVTVMKFKGLLRYQKPHVTDYISIYLFAYNVLYADSLYCYLYSNIRYNIQCRITNFLHCASQGHGIIIWPLQGCMFALRIISAAIMAPKRDCKVYICG